MTEAPRGGDVPYEETPPSKRVRIAWLIGAWVVVIGPFTVLFFMWAGPWFGLMTLSLALWLTYDYLQRGGFFAQIDSKDLATGHEEWRIRRLF